MTGSAAPSPAHYNQQIYQRLKLSLSLDLRRQLFVAVCDDPNLRNRLAGQLHRELVQQGADQVATAIERSGVPTVSEHLVSLKLNLNDPNPIAQVSHWLRNNVPRDPRDHQREQSMPAFQILGIEQLTRQPAAVQRLFLSYLRTLERHLPALNSALVLWVTRPWYHNIRKSAPECWQWCSGIFEFMAEPVPLASDERPEASAPEMDALTPGADSGVIYYDVAAAQADGDFEVVTEHYGAASVIAGEAAAQATAHASTIASPAEDSLVEVPSEISKGNDRSSEQADDAPSSPETTTPVVAQNALSQPNNSSKTKVAQKTTVLSSFANQAERDEAQLLAHIEVLRQQDASSEDLALAYLELGRFYRRRLEQGDKSQDFTRFAIVSYEQVLEWLCFHDPNATSSSLSWPDTLNDLGTLYWMASRQPESPEMGLSYIKLAIQTYRLGLKNTKPEDNPRAFAMLQNNLGTVHSDFAHHEEPAENLTAAIQAYKEALRFRQPESAPLKYASTQNNLGTAYWHLAQHDSAPENLKWAIAAYSQAAQFYNPDEQPDSYAMIQNNLGTAYWNLAQIAPNEEAQDGSGHFMANEWLSLAINAYNNALRFRTLEVAPGSYASTQNNLGTAYWQLANQPGQETTKARDYLKLGIQAYEEALKAAKSLKQNGLLAQLSFDPYATHSNTGLVHYQLATDFAADLDDEAQQAHLDRSLQHHSRAMTGWKEKPELYEPAVAVLVQTIQHCYEKWGSSGQNRALGLVPAELLPELLPKL